MTNEPNPNDQIRTPQPVVSEVEPSEIRNQDAAALAEVGVLSKGRKGRVRTFCATFSRSAR